MRRSQPWQTNRARTLRANATPAEKKLWAKLRNQQVCGEKFVRQFPIGPYFADFACREPMLVVEIDGETHHTDAQVAHDAERERCIVAAGYRVLRFGNGDVHEGLEDVVIAIAEACATLGNEMLK